MKKKKWSTVKEMLFLYLAISKMFYWFTTVVQLEAGGFDRLGQVLFNRLLERDLLIIFAILFFFFIERFQFKPIVNHAISYVTLLAVVFIQIWAINHFLGPVSFETAGAAAFLVGIGYLGFFVYFTIGFFTIAIAMSIKEHLNKMKNKGSAETGGEGAAGTMSDFSNALICETCKDELRDKLNLFGQFVGEWEFEGVIGKDTPEEQRVPGEWIFSWILDGTAIQDVFICPSRKECEKNPNPNAEYGTTIRFYNQATDAWDMFYGLSGKTHILEGQQAGAQIIVKNKSESEGLTQWVFSDITPDAFHWQNRTSYDEGVTWNINFELFAHRK